MELTSYLLGKKAGGGGGSNLQTKSVTITENGSVTINPDENYDGMSKVNLTTNVPTGDPNKKAFQTQTTTEMNNLSTMKEDDLCVVYSDTHDELVIPTSGTNTYYFPKHVTLPNAITEEDSTTTSGNQFSGMYVFTINPTSFTLAFKNFVGTQPKIEYTSSDGINYTRTSEDNTYTFSNSITEEKTWLPYFIIMNRQTEYTGTYNYTEDDEWDRVAVPNLTAGNVKENVTILGVTGTYAGAGQENDVNFYDYMGNLVYSYTAQEFQALTELPAGPTHEGMTFQEWNWTLSDAKTFVTNHGCLDIGETCITSDGKTRVYINLPEGRTNPSLGVAVNGTINIDWGDGNSEDITGSSLTTLILTPHSYSQKGEYTITLTPSGTSEICIYSTESISKLLYNGDLTTNSTSETYPQNYMAYIEKVELGNNISLSSYAFTQSSMKYINIPSETHITSVPSRCFQQSDIRKIVIPKSVTSLDSYCFYYSNLELICLPKNISMPNNYTFSGAKLKKFIAQVSGTAGTDVLASTKLTKLVINISAISNNFAQNTELEEIKLTGVTSINGTAFSRAKYIKELTLPSTTTSLGTTCFANCWALSKVEFLGNTSSLGKNAFQECHNLAVVNFTHNTSIPTVYANTFSYTPSDLKIVVPDSLYETWITTGNWTNYASNIVKASDYTG